MTISLLIGIIAIPLLMVLWGLVQVAWRKNFAEYITDADALACRRSGGSCGCGAICQMQNLSQNGTHKLSRRKAWHN